MQKKKQVGKRLTALVLCMAMLLTGPGPWFSVQKVNAASSEVQREAGQVERSERKMKFNDNWKFKLVNKYDINDNSVQADGMDYKDKTISLQKMSLP